MEDWLDTRFDKEQSCCWCGHKFDAVGSPTGDTPMPGDNTVCIRCGGAMKFDKNLNLRKMTKHDLRMMRADEREDLEKFQATVRKIRQ